MQTQTIKCSVCGASISLEEKNLSNIIECKYCGSTITINGPATEEIQKTQQQTVELLLKQKKKIKIEYDTRVFQANEQKDKAKKMILIGAIVLLIFAFPFFPLGIAGLVLIIVGIVKIQKANEAENFALVEYNRETEVINKKLNQ